MNSNFDIWTQKHKFRLTNCITQIIAIMQLKDYNIAKQADVVPHQNL